MKRVAAIAIINDHHMLMGKRRDNGRWTNPGGHLDAGEDPVKGAAREVEEETGLKLDPHLFKHIETRVVTKKSGGKIEVHGFRVDLRNKPSTSMKQDPDGEVHRWHWLKLDTDLDHVKDNLHVPLGDNVLLDNILKEKTVRRHIKRFWDGAKKMGVDEVKDKALKEGPQQYLQRKEKNEKKASELIVGGKADGKPDREFPKDQLRMGRKVEREHTNDPAKANEIVKDHLMENRKYYTHLKEMEDKYVEKKAAFGSRAEKVLKFVGRHPGATVGAISGGTRGYNKDIDKKKNKNLLGKKIINTAIGATGGAAMGSIFDSMHRPINGNFRGKSYNYGGYRRNSYYGGNSYSQHINKYKDHLQTIGATGSEKTKAELKKKYRDLAFKHHPDRGGDQETMKRVNAAWDEIQKDPSFQKLAVPTQAFWMGFKKEAGLFSGFSKAKAATHEAAENINRAASSFNELNKEIKSRIPGVEAHIKEKSDKALKYFKRGLLGMGGVYAASKAATLPGEYEKYKYHRYNSQLAKRRLNEVEKKDNGK